MIIDSVYSSLIILAPARVDTTQVWHTNRIRFFGPTRRSEHVGGCSARRWRTRMALA